ncbi:P-loop NTPase family protein [Algihabitans albus]|uniref:DnaA ATPase domain-containing protein n=1 Tax=Algihabitans albus TaxID=2164067 RepID=UPI000E5D4EE7|nr:DnaA/Hda family protein [Algihabitans albus]
MSQLPLELPQRPALGRGDFLVAPANEAAVAWIDRWPDWPSVALVLVGPPGSGKSHLAEVWHSASGASPVTPADLKCQSPDRLVERAQVLLLEDAEGNLGGEGEEALLHLYNLLAERGGQLLLTGLRAPKRWNISLPDLASRLATATVAELGAPDDALLQAVLVKLFADRQLLVTAELVEFLQRRIPRSFAAARAIVAAIDRRALAEQRGITITVARAALAEEVEALEALEDQT